jgi:hypothetical protein
VEAIIKENEAETSLYEVTIAAIDLAFF